MVAISLNAYGGIFMGTEPASLAERRWQTFFSVDLFEKAAKAGGTTIIGLYALGLMVSNEYLMLWGVSDFSSFRPKCIVTGTWTFLLFMGCLLPVLSPILLVPTPTLKTISGIGRLIGAIMLGVVVGLSLMVVVLDTITRHKVSTFFLWYAFGEIIFAPVAFLFCAAIYRMTRTYLRFRPVGTLLAGTLALGTILSFVYGVSLAVYGAVPEALGGGQSVAGQLILNKDGVRVWKQLAGGINSETVDSGFTGSVQILYQNDREFLLKTDKQELLLINKSLFDGFIPDEKQLRHHVRVVE
jgi:hypothetical protein